MTHYSFMIIDPLASLGDESEIRRTLSFIKNCGYEGIEWNLTPALIAELESLETWHKENDLVIPSFMTGEAYHEGLCLSSPDAAVQRRAVDRLISYLEVAKRFDAILVVGLMQGHLKDEPNTKIANRRIIAGLQEVGVTAESQGVELVIEPVNHMAIGFNNSVAEVRHLIRAIGSPAFKPMVDTIHMNVEETSLTQPIYDCGKDLRHVHLCESNGSLFGSGNIDFTPVLKALHEIHYAGFASVKVYRKASLPDAARSSIRILHEAEASF